MNKWKITGIIFIVLFILSWTFFISMFLIGNAALNKDLECANEVCFNNADADAYMFDQSTNTCICLNNGEIVYQEVL